MKLGFIASDPSSNDSWLLNESSLKRIRIKTSGVAKASDTTNGMFGIENELELKRANLYGISVRPIANLEFEIRSDRSSRSGRFVEWLNRVNACFGSNGNSVRWRMKEYGKKLKIKKMMIETMEFGGGVILKRSKQVAVKLKKNEFGDEMKSWNGDGLALRLDKLENGIKVKREEGERKKRGGE